MATFSHVLYFSLLKYVLFLGKGFSYFENNFGFAPLANSLAQNVRQAFINCHTENVQCWITTLYYFLPFLQKCFKIENVYKVLD